MTSSLVCGDGRYYHLTHHTIDSLPSLQHHIFFLIFYSSLSFTSTSLRVMTSTSPTLPDISSLSISPQQQHRPHDSPYDFDPLQAGQNQRQQFHFSTSPAVPGQVPFNPLGLGQSPLKSKPVVRAALPAVRVLAPSSLTRFDLTRHVILAMD